MRKIGWSIVSALALFMLSACGGDEDSTASSVESSAVPTTGQPGVTKEWGREAPDATITIGWTNKEMMERTTTNPEGRPKTPQPPPVCEMVGEPWTSGMKVGEPITIIYKGEDYATAVISSTYEGNKKCDFIADFKSPGATKFHLLTEEQWDEERAVDGFRLSNGEVLKVRQEMNDSFYFTIDEEDETSYNRPPLYTPPS